MIHVTERTLVESRTINGAFEMNLTHCRYIVKVTTESAVKAKKVVL